MTPDEELMLIFGTLHLVALALGIVLFVLFLRSEAGPDHSSGDDDEPGGGGNDRRPPDLRPKTSPSGGIPLPDAEPARVRLRTHETLRDARGRPERRRDTEPAEPRRVRTGASA
jgi:hypothetical protein